MKKRLIIALYGLIHIMLIMPLLVAAYTLALINGPVLVLVSVIPFAICYPYIVATDNS